MYVTLALCICVCSVLSHAVMMFPYTEDSLTAFNFEGSAVLARSSDDEIHGFQASHSSADNLTSAELHMWLDSPGFVKLFHAFSRQKIYVC